MENIDELINEYMEDCKIRKRLDDKTIRAYKIDLNQFIRFVENEYLNSDKIKEYVLFLNRMYSKPKTVKRKIASIKGFFSYLEYVEKIEATPFRKIRTQLREPILLPKTIERNVLDSIFTHLYEDIKYKNSEYKKRNAIRNAAIIELLFCTGIRISELCNIKRSNMDLSTGILKIFGKGSKERIICIGNSSVLDILSKYSKLNLEMFSDSKYFFLNKTGGVLSDQSVRKILNNMEKELKLSVHITPHMFRHTFATMLLDKDVDIRYIQKILGHSSISITQIYTHVSDAKQKEILMNKNPRSDFGNYDDR